MCHASEENHKSQSAQQNDAKWKASVVGWKKASATIVGVRFEGWTTVETNCVANGDVDNDALAVLLEPGSSRNWSEKLSSFPM